MSWMFILQKYQCNDLDMCSIWMPFKPIKKKKKIIFLSFIVYDTVGIKKFSQWSITLWVIVVTQQSCIFLLIILYSQTRNVN